MKILVCIKQVLDPTGLSVNRKAEKVFIQREEYRLDPASLAALEAAERLQAAAAQAGAATEIIAVSVGPARVDEALRAALARGADRAVLIRLDNNPDATVVTRLLATALQPLGPIDLVLCGDRSIDTGGGEIAARLAEALDWPQILRAVRVEVTGSRVTAVVQQPAHEMGNDEGGTPEGGGDFVALEAVLPVVVSIEAAAFSGKHANGWRLMDAYRQWEVEILTPADLALGADDLRCVTVKQADAFPPERQFGTPVHSAAELVTMLKREKIIA